MMADKEVLFLDETSFNLWMRKGRIWMHKDRRMSVKICPGKQKFVTVYGAISSTHNRFYYQICDATNTFHSKSFLKQLALEYEKAEEEVFVVLDNHQSHVSDQVAEVFAESMLKPLFLPPYSSLLNPIESFWAFMKGKWKNHLCEAGGMVLPDMAVQELNTFIINMDCQPKNFATAAYDNYLKVLEKHAEAMKEAGDPRFNEEEEDEEKEKEGEDDDAQMEVANIADIANQPT